MSFIPAPIPCIVATWTGVGIDWPAWLIVIVGAASVTALPSSVMQMCTSRWRVTAPTTTGGAVIGVVVIGVVVIGVVVIDELASDPIGAIVGPLPIVVDECMPISPDSITSPDF